MRILPLLVGPTHKLVFCPLPFKILIKLLQQESNDQRRLPSPPEIEYGDWSAKKVEETEFERTARILGVLFPAPPISSATPISGNDTYIFKKSLQVLVS